jgi:zinc-ribbon domain
MYCPRCGNHPASDRMRFCPSCGLRLDGVFDLLVRDGYPANSSVIPQVKEPSPRKRGIKQGAKICFFSIAAFLPVLGLCAAADSGFPLFLPVTTFLSGIFWMIYYRLFVDEYEPPVKNTQAVVAPVASQPTYLPPPQAVPAYRSPIEQPQQQSVVENTTRSLGSE